VTRNHNYPEHINGAAVLEYGPTEISAPTQAISTSLRVSADRTANSAAHTRAKRAVPYLQLPRPCETRTVRWREMDSNFSYRDTRAVDIRSIPGIARASAGSAWPIVRQPEIRR